LGTNIFYDGKNIYILDPGVGDDDIDFGKCANYFVLKNS